VALAIGVILEGRMALLNSSIWVANFCRVILSALFFATVWSRAFGRGALEELAKSDGNMGASKRRESEEL
jgi:hypothetical protein